MKQCTEFAVFRILKENSEKVIELSKVIFEEMNAEKTVITSWKILKNTDKPDEICWHLTWINVDAAKATTEKWPTFPSTKEFQELVVKDLYYGHFVNVE